MTQGEMVTKFKITPEMPIKDLLAELNAHLNLAGVEPEEYGFREGGPAVEKPLPLERDFHWFVAFAVEGTNEGYYVHVGAIMWPWPNNAKFEQDLPGGKLTLTYQQSPNSDLFQQFGVAKMNSADNAYSVCREAQRFLTAVLWN